MKINGLLYIALGFVTGAIIVLTAIVITIAISGS